MPDEFIRARQPEHKHQRREAIIAAARKLALRSGVSHVSLGAVAAEAGFAKSNVARYFATREEIYLLLTSRELSNWAGEVAGQLPPAASPEMIADMLVGSLRERPLLCDLIVHSGVTLPDNSSFEAVRANKLTGLEAVMRLSAAVAAACPRLTRPRAAEVIVAATLLTSLLDQTARRSHRLADAPDVDPDLATALSALEPDPARLVAALIRGIAEADRAAPPAS
jgi:AcrR family transcriptional regulator